MLLEAPITEMFYEKHSAAKITQTTSGGKKLTWCQWVAGENLSKRELNFSKMCNSWPDVCTPLCALKIIHQFVMNYRKLSNSSALFSTMKVLVNFPFCLIITGEN